MKREIKSRRGQHGFSLIEVLVTLVILLLGLLGLVGLMVTSQRSQLESYQRVQALVVAQDMVSRINTNRKSAPCYAFTPLADGSKYLGTGASVTPACTEGTAEQKALAIADMNQWSNLLLGSAETTGGSNVGAMLGARGCVEEVATDEYRVSVVWQGTSKTAAVADVACGQTLYGSDEALRRVVTVPVMIPPL